MYFPMIFRKGSVPIKFRIIGNNDKLKKAINSNGGILTNSNPDYILVNDLSSGPKGAIRFSWIEDCLKEKKLLDSKKYTCSSVGYGGRKPFKKGEDECLLDFVRKWPGKKGEAMWKALEAKFPKRTWQSYRDRYEKHLKLTTIELPKSPCIKTRDYSSANRNFDEFYEPEDVVIDDPEAIIQREKDRVTEAISELECAEVFFNANPLAEDEEFYLPATQIAIPEIETNECVVLEQETSGNDICLREENSAETDTQRLETADVAEESEYGNNQQTDNSRNVQPNEIMVFPNDSPVPRSSQPEIVDLSSNSDNDEEPDEEDEERNTLPLESSDEEDKVASKKSETLISSPPWNSEASQIIEIDEEVHISISDAFQWEQRSVTPQNAPFECETSKRSRDDFEVNDNEVVKKMKIGFENSEMPTVVNDNNQTTPTKSNSLSDSSSEVDSDDVIMEADLTEEMASLEKNIRNSPQKLLADEGSQTPRPEDVAQVPSPTQIEASNVSSTTSLPLAPVDLFGLDIAPKQKSFKSITPKRKEVDPLFEECKPFIKLVQELSKVTRKSYKECYDALYYTNGNPKKAKLYFDRPELGWNRLQDLALRRGDRVIGKTSKAVKTREKFLDTWDCI